MPGRFTQEQFDDALDAIVADESRGGRGACRVVARDLHRAVVGGARPNRMPMACKAMWKLADEMPHTVIHETPSGQSTTLEIEYHLDARSNRADRSERGRRGRAAHADPRPRKTRHTGELGRTAHLPDADLYLVSCVKVKRDTPAPAKELYVSAWFRKARACVERTGRRWAVLSAKHGLVWPDQIVAPYDQKLRAGESRAWSERVLADLEPHLGGVSSVVFLAGDVYRQHLAEGLLDRGIGVRVPMEGLDWGSQGAWLRDCLAAPPTVDAARIAEALAGDFYGDMLDLSSRPGTAGSPWSRMPEVESVRRLRANGADERCVRRFLTFVCAMDRSRDAERLWRDAADLWEAHPEVFDPAYAAAMSRAALRSVLCRARVSQRHGPDVDAWRTIAGSLAIGGPVRCVVDEGAGAAAELLRDLRARNRTGRARFPLLRGSKIAPMWVRIMVNPGNARIADVESIPVAVDVQVRRVTENLGVTATRAVPLDEAKSAIQEAWRAAIARSRIGGPAGIAGTCAALDPALWFYGKHGCSHCERQGRRVPIGRACDHCRFAG